MFVTDPQFDFLGRVLDVSALRHSVLSQNIANVNTPGFQCHEVRFEEMLRRRLETGQLVTGVQAEVVEGGGGAERLDGNNVDIDLELGRLQKNALLFRTYSQILAHQLNQCRSAISGR